jgi:hypothetical protein
MWRPFHNPSTAAKKPGIPGILGFLCEIAGHWLHFRERWFDAMSGGASVPFAALAVLATTPWGQQILPMWAQTAWAQNVFWAAAVVCAWIAAYRVWKPEREKVLGLEEKLKPRIDVIYDNNNQNCDGTTPFIGPQRQHGNLRYFRLRVINVGNVSIPNCTGILKEFINSKTGEKVESQTLVWATGPSGSASVTLVPDAPMYLQLCAINDDSNMFNVSTESGWPLRHEKMLNEHGEYLFKVTIGSDNTVWVSRWPRLVGPRTIWPAERPAPGGPLGRNTLGCVGRAPTDGHPVC